MLLIMGALFGLIFLYKLSATLLLKYYIAHQSRVVTVSATTVKPSPWQPLIKASGSLRAIRGVNITTELAGMIQKIYFTPGQDVAAGTVLLQLNADSEIGQYESLQAQTALAQITYERDKKQFQIHAISKQVLDTDFQNWRSLQGQLAQQAATVAKKTIRAPFSGRLGISKINLGQYINPGDTIVMLQTLNPIYVDFFVPQQRLSQLSVGQIVTLTLDNAAGKKFLGKITTVNPAVESNSRNVEVEATVENSELILAPGMFVNLEVQTGQAQNYLTLPQTAVTFNPYGDLVYLIKKSTEKKHGKDILTVSQRFVKTGEHRGDQVMITDGLKEGDVVVTSGQLKLKNGSIVEINNTVEPADNAQPFVEDEH